MSLADRDRRYVWHPFTQMQAWLNETPLVIERGEGNYLVDTEGRRYLDGVSSLWANLHGHRRPEIDQAIREQLDRIAHSTLLGLASPPSIELAERLVRLAPAGLVKVFYSDNGSTAIEVALKMAFQHWLQRGRAEKRSFVALEGAYHGDTLGAVSVGGIGLFHEIFRPLLFPVHHICADPEASALRRLLETRADEIAALVVEPLVQGASGMRLQPRGFLRRAAEVCRAANVLLIVDEVATGFGRTGTLFACEQENVSPDLMAVAKGLSAGYLPLAATLATQRVFDSFLGETKDLRTFFHGHTYTGNALACAAAIASLDIFERERVLERVRVTSAHLGTLLDERIAPLPGVAEVRRVGLMTGIEIRAAAGALLPPAAGGSGDTLGYRICRAVRSRGVILRPLGNVIVLMPPLSITSDELGHLVQATREAILEVLG
jgi:adenosylmethionine-8-amino-7-oxononanoate aminotransferase